MTDNRLPCRHLLASFLAFLFLLAPAWVQADNQPERAGVASAHPLADRAGYEILDKGGNAFDAAVAVSAVLAVVEPYSSGLGGGGFYLLHRAEDGFETMIDARETAPAAATPDMFLDEHGNVDRALFLSGALSAGIPGTPAALVHMAREYGRLPLAASLTPAIRLARDGFRLDPRFAAMTVDYRERLLEHCVPGCPFLQDDRHPLEAGELFRQPELAATLAALASHQGESFYRGETARRLVDGVQARGGIWTLDDLKHYRVIEREPVRGEYRGMRITTAAPPSSGGVTLLETLNMLAGFELAELSPDQRMHYVVEALRRAFRDRNEFLGDPAFVDMPLERLTSPLYAAGLRAGIDTERATPSTRLPAVIGKAQSRHTTHFSILDRNGNRVAATQTVNFRFGSGVVAPGTGVTINNEMSDFAAKPGKPNAWGLVEAATNGVLPGKRPLSSMTPTFIDSERGVAILGTPGGSRIISMVALGVLQYAAGGDAEDMVSMPRFHHQYLPDVIEHEPVGFDAGTLARLRERGHSLKPMTRLYGNMNVVTWERRSGEVEVAHDPRNSKARVDF